MNINIFDSPESVIKFDRKYIHLRSYIFVADMVMLTTRDININLLNIDILSLTDEMALAIGKLEFSPEDDIQETLAGMENSLPMMKKMKNMKRKDKIVLMALGNFQNAYFNLKRSINWEVEQMIKNYKVMTLSPFIEENIWNIANLNVFSNVNKEDDYIHHVCDSILQRKDFMGLDEILAEKFVATTLDNEDNTGCDFIKIPLWDVPVDEGMPLDKIKYTRSDLQTALKPFNAHLNELKEELNKIQFVTENLLEIQNRCREKIIEHIAPVQQAIDNSIYLSHQRNQSQEDTHSKLYLGVSSSAMLVDYLENFEVIAPYVASEVRERLAKQMDLKATRLFFYQDVNPTHWYVPEENETEQHPKVT